MNVWTSRPVIGAIGFVAGVASVSVLAASPSHLADVELAPPACESEASDLQREFVGVELGTSPYGEEASQLTLIRSSLNEMVEEEGP